MICHEAAVTRAIRAQTIEADVLRRGSRKECECLLFRRDRTPDNSESRSLETFAILVVYDFGWDTALGNQDFALIDQKFLLRHQGRVPGGSGITLGDESVNVREILMDDRRVPIDPRVSHGFAPLRVPVASNLLPAAQTVPGGVFRA